MLNDRTVLGDGLPEDWEFEPREFRERTPGSVFRCRIVGRYGSYGPPRRTPHRMFAGEPGNWRALEVWCTDTHPDRDVPGPYALSTGTRIWRRHEPEFPPLRRLP